MAVGCGGGDNTASIGQAGEKAKAARVVEIRQVDSLLFEPASIEVKANETVTLRIVNGGSIIHEFFLGDAKAQDSHNEEMEDMGSMPMDMADTPNSVTVDPGATEELTWTFPDKGTVQFGCHQPGHYGGGMKGTVTVT